MKHLLWLLLLISFAAPAAGQSNQPVRMAIIAVTPALNGAESFLTAELSKDPQIALFERNEVDKVYREQGLSAENRNYVKLGQVLGADGLCLLEITKTATKTNLSIRVVAVKPGVIVLNQNFTWPVENFMEWAAVAGVHLKPSLPRLRVLEKDAIPLSVVNIRSAMASKEGADKEQQLKLLTIQRLSREPQFFVLERQKMQLLGDEKALKGFEEEAFWNGSYLLEGVLDQNGYSESTLTISARLAPAKGGTPLIFEVSGSRTNLPEVVNRLALKISELLKTTSTVKEWNPYDEALEYYQEATWALQWGVLPEAQMASDSAWALGKQDLDCAVARMKAYLPEVTSGMYDFEHSSAIIGDDTDVPGEMRNLVRDLQQRQFAAYIYNIHGYTLDYIALAKPPPPESIDRAINTLSLYQNLSCALASQFKSTNDVVPPPVETWYRLGVVDLTAVAKVLERFQFVPGSEKPVAEKLAELRAEARRVDELISDLSPAKRQYFVGDKIVSLGSLRHQIDDGNNTLACEVQWGCFWQETPEDCLSLYRNLLQSPAFCMFHEDFWIRKPEQPRLVAWNDRDRSRIPELWNRFTQELNDSTNLLWRMEALALAFADAPNKAARDAGYTNLFNFVSEHREELRRNPFPIFSDRWHLDTLFSESLSYSDLYDSQLRPLLSGIDMEYTAKTIPEAAEAALLPEQKKYLEAKTPLQHSEFSRLFFAQKYSRDQALELQPLVNAYKSNLVVQSQVSKEAWTKLEPAMTDAFSLAYDINHTVDPTLPRTAPWEGRPGPPGARPTIASPVDRTTTSNSIHRPVPLPTLTEEVIRKPLRVARATHAEPGVATNIIIVNKFIDLPLPEFPGEHIPQQKITAHQFVEGKLLLDFTQAVKNLAIYTNDPAELHAYEQPSAIAVFDPATERLDIIPCPAIDLGMGNPFRYRTTLFHGDVYHSDGAQISRYDSKTKKWEILPISNGANYELFNVAEHLYAANRSTIFEIVDAGKSTRLLASTRRNPPVTTLDCQNLGTPILAEGPNHSLRVIGNDKIFTLVNDDWVEECTAPQRSWTPETLPEGILFRYNPGGQGQPDYLSHLAVETKSPELLLLQQGAVPRLVGSSPDFYKKINAALVQQPLWSRPKGLALAKLPATIHDSDLYLLSDHSETQDIVDGMHVIELHKVLPKDNYHAALLRFCRDSSDPQTVFLRFDSPDGCPPATGIEPRIRPLFPHTPPVWMLFTPQFLVLGTETVEGNLQQDVNNLGLGYKTGFWLLPLSQLEPEIETQKQSQTARTKAVDATRQTGQESLLAKYDKDHNGVIKGEEKEEALKDWDFLESQLNIIDADRNHRLTVNELAYFDANSNGILETNEESAIYAVQELLAVKLLEEVDRDEDGKIDQYEFFAMLGRDDFGGFHAFQKVDATSEAERLEIFFRNRLKESLDPRGYQNVTGFNRLTNVPPPPTFKERVESSWAWKKAHPIVQKP